MDTTKSNQLIAEFLGAERGGEEWLDHLIMDMETGGKWYTGEKQPKMPQSFIKTISKRSYGDYLFSCPLEELLFHKSWDWLMPVVEKIALLIDGSSITIEYGTGCTDSFSNCTLRFNGQGKPSIVIDTPLLKDEDGSEGFMYNIYKSVVEFIKEYNDKIVK